MTVNPKQMYRRGPLYGSIAAGGFSMLGNAVAGVALPWFVLTLTDSAAWTGAAAAAGLFPLIVGSFFGGPVVDRFGSRLVALAADLLSAASIASIPLLFLSGHLTLTALLCLVVVGALLDGPGRIAMDSRIPDLARLAGLPIERITAIDEMLENAATIMGPPIAGLAIAAFGVEKTLFVTAICSLIAATINSLALPRDRQKPKGKSGSDDLLAGVKFLIDDPLLRTILLLFMVVIAIFAALNTVIMPVIFHAAGSDAMNLGAFLASAAGGALVSALLFSVWGHRANGRLVLLIGLFLSSAAITVIAAVEKGPLLFVAAALLGLSTGALGPQINAVFLRRAPSAIRGSVLGASTSAALVATPIAILIAGITVEALGASTVLFTLAGTLFVLALLASLNRALRSLTAKPNIRQLPNA
jgi:macrolide resistance protein